ncbi:MAG: polyphenol oxidase family protein [Candidatus Eiseniibacteriota bacterium]
MWNLDPESPLPMWRAPGAGPGVSLAFSTRRGGISAPPFDTLNLGRSSADQPEAVAENRRRFLASLGLESAALATAGQVHGRRVERALEGGHYRDCDALVTTRAGLVLAVTTADCMSLLLVAPGAVGAAHSGWRGTADGMPRAALDSVCEAGGVTSGEVTVHLGPCIRGCCYEVGPEVAARFPAESLRTEGGRSWLDLPTAARMQLRAGGVTQIHDTGACTACEPYWYFSHRRDHGSCGRHWAIAALNGAKISQRV